MNENAQMNRIMLVDDNRDLCDTVKDRLERLLHVTVDALYDGDTMLDELSRGPRVPYRIVILDMWMPRREGGPIETTIGIALLRAHHILAPGTPVIIYTGNENFDDCVASIKAGAYDYIPKIDKEPGRDRLLECCRRILHSEVDELDQWVAVYGKEMVQKCGSMYAAVLPLAEVTPAQIEFTPLGDKALITGYSMGEVRHKMLTNRLLRWNEPRILKVPAHH